MLVSAGEGWELEAAVIPLAEVEWVGPVEYLSNLEADIGRLEWKHGCKNDPSSAEAKRVVDLLYDTTLISSGYTPNNPAEVGNKIYEMMVIALGGRWGRTDSLGAAEEADAEATSSKGSFETTEAEVVEPSEVRTEDDPWKD
ncbi:heat shock protein 90-5, chloroplastic-like [Zingiber officinale]|uniref:heat shock protein 90-5, chloroplastic-like n=1 Tax=Zingiber officinale TaxID=94328 RepID=UPI001C4B7691|nr:heat shock protein 90-5, chloroplastic-like [Zingiber officinale]